MRRTHSINLLGTIIALASLAFLPAVAQAQSDTVWIGRYVWDTGRVDAGSSNYVQAHSAAKAMYPGLSNAEIFRTLFSDEGYVLGFSAQRRTRGMDVIEDYDYQFANPAEISNWSSTSQKIYWADIYNPNPSDTYNWSLILRNGEHAGASVFKNPDILAMGDDDYIVLNADGSFSRYGLDGLQDANIGGWQTFADGRYKGRRFDDVLGDMIGYEDGILVFLEGDSTIVRYGIGGKVSEVSEFSFANAAGDKGPDLSQYSLGDIIDGKVEGFSYIGWDNGPVVIDISLVPEPAAAAVLAGIAAMAALALRKRRAA